LVGGHSLWRRQFLRIVITRALWRCRRSTTGRRRESLTADGPATGISLITRRRTLLLCKWSLRRRGRTSVLYRWWSWLRLLIRYWSKHLVSFRAAKPNQFWGPPLGIFPIYLNQAGNEEVPLFGCSGPPVVWLDYGNNKAKRSASLYVRPSMSICCRIEVVERLDSGKIFEVPSLSDREGPIVILASLVDSHTTSAPYSHNDDSRLLVVSR